MGKFLIKKKIISTASLSVSITLFILVSYFLKNNLDLLKGIVFDQGKILGMFYYVFLSIALVMVSLASSIPLMPVASLAWGWVLSGILTSIAWIVGTQILFEAARKIGKPLFGRIISRNHLNKKIQTILLKKNFYFEIILLRMFFYDDILSYILGIFTNLKRSQILYINIAGAIPPAFVLAYFGTLEIKYQLILMLATVFLFYLIFYRKNGNGGD